MNSSFQIHQETYCN